MVADPNVLTYRVIGAVPDQRGADISMTVEVRHGTVELWFGNTGRQLSDQGVHQLCQLLSDGLAEAQVQRRGTKETAE